jgi:hypothetical protein
MSVLFVKTLTRADLFYSHIRLQPFERSWLIGGFSELVIPALERGESLHFPKLDRYPNSPFQNYLIDYGLQAGSVIPLVYDGDLVGWVILGIFEARTLDEEVILYAQQVTGQLSVDARVHFISKYKIAESLERKVAERHGSLKKSGGDEDSVILSA